MRPPDDAQARVLPLVYAGRRVHATTVGMGEPPIVLLTGLGVPARSWREPPPAPAQAALMLTAPWGERTLLEPALARFARVVTYDRAGLGESEPPSQPRDLGDFCGELEAVLDAAGVTRAVLVGHSLGGLIAFALALRRPQRVLGLVLLDAPHPDQHARFMATPAAQEWAWEAAHLTQAAEQHPERPNWPALLGGGPEFTGPGVLGRCPLVVVRRGVVDTLERARRFNPAASAAGVQALAAEWAAMQEAYARTSSLGRVVVAGRSGHYVHWDEPEVVLRAVQEVWQEACNRNGEGTAR